MLGAIPVIVLPLYGFGRAVRRRSRAAQDTLADASAYAAELIGAVRTLQAFTNETLATQAASPPRSSAPSRRRVQLDPRARDPDRDRDLPGVRRASSLVLWVGAQDVMAGDITPGRLSQFVLYAVFAASGLGQLSEVWGEISQASGAAERLFEILAIKPAIEPPAHPVAAAGSRRAARSRSTTCASPIRRGRRRPVLDGVSFRVRPRREGRDRRPLGRRQEHDLPSDPALLRSDLRHRSPSTACGSPTPIRRRCAGTSRWCRRTPSIFAASIADNIRFGRPDASDAEVERAAELALAAEFIRRLPQGFDTQVGERGVTLSGGQRQRIAIARAILRDAPLLLLDEATSSLDAESETLVQAALERLMAERTTLVIAHRLATVLSCDRILVMDARPHRRGRHARAARRRRRPLCAARQAAVPEPSDAPRSSRPPAHLAASARTGDRD